MKKLIIPFAVLIGLAACQTNSNVIRNSQVSLLSLAKPDLAVGDTYAYYRNGDKETLTVTAKSPNGFAFEITEGSAAGCTSEGLGFMSPDVKWADCDGSSGTQTVVKKGDIWPLKVGTMESFDIEGTDGKDTWSTTRDCIVAGTAMVTVGAKTIPTYEVVCTDGSSTRSWFYSPDNKWPIKYTKVHKKRGLVEDNVIDLGQGAS
ncbi:hypothetical protein [Thalassospira alkalitolerans]|uniref:hypothetical protein n=1 Tax=Thalassospira alkalitolerans TaxID=1293890 RepID=UPI003AA93791